MSFILVPCHKTWWRCNTYYYYLIRQKCNTHCKDLYFVHIELQLFYNTKTIKNRSKNKNRSFIHHTNTYATNYKRFIKVGTNYKILIDVPTSRRFIYGASTIYVLSYL